MAATDRTPEPLTKQERAAARIAQFTAEQKRLKELAAQRRADVSSHGGKAPVDRAWSVGRGRQGQR